MTAEKTYTFDGYTLRPAHLSDIALAVRWTAADADHAGRTRPEFWTEQTMQRDSYMLEDEDGPIFFFKLHRLSLTGVELHCQFPPAEDVSQLRVQNGIAQGFQWLETVALKGGKVNELFFDSTHGPLRSFAVRRLGFRPLAGDRLKKIVGGQ